MSSLYVEVRASGRDLSANRRRLGAQALDSGCAFQVWAPFADSAQVSIESPGRRTLDLERDEQGYYTGYVEDFGPGTRYFFVLNGDSKRPDPASRFQPEGVHGPSEVVDNHFDWTDTNWKGIALEDY